MRVCAVCALRIFGIASTSTIGASDWDMILAVVSCGLARIVSRFQLSKNGS